MSRNVPASAPPVDPLAAGLTIQQLEDLAAFDKATAGVALLPLADAQRLLGITERQRLNLVSLGVLRLVGTHRDRRISVASARAYFVSLLVAPTHVHHAPANLPRSRELMTGRRDSKRVDVELGARS